jgi:hypothetical protein
MWKTHIKMKRQQLTLKTRQTNWLIGKRSQLSLENKVLLYKAILKPIWTYSIELWGCAKPSNTKIPQTFQSKTLRDITGAPWYVSNKTIHEDLNIPLITDVIKKNKPTDTATGLQAMRTSYSRNYHTHTYMKERLARRLNKLNGRELPLGSYHLQDIRIHHIYLLLPIWRSRL